MRLYDLLFTALCSIEEEGAMGYAMIFGGDDANYKVFKYCLEFNESSVVNLDKYKDLEVKRIQVFESETFGYIFKYTTEDERDFIQFRSVTVGENEEKESKDGLLEITADMENKEFEMYDSNRKLNTVETKQLLQIIAGEPCTEIDAKDYPLKTLENDFIRYLTAPSLLIKAVEMEKISKEVARKRVELLLDKDVISYETYEKVLEKIA